MGEHGRLGSVYRAAARAPGLRVLRRTPLVERLVDAHFRGQAVEQTLRYTLTGAFRRGAVGRYRPRGMSLDVHLRQGTSDGNVVQEFTVSRLYDPPQGIRDRLGTSPRVLDLGGHVGLFGAYALTLWPGARVISFEPDPHNAALLERTAAGSGRDWQVVRAAAWTENTTLRFRPDYAESHVAPDGPLTVAAIDVLPYLADCDLAKIDVEGAEWRLLRDPRFAASAPAAMIVECHPASRGAEGETLLRGLGFETRAVAGAPPGAALFWCLR